MSIQNEIINIVTLLMKKLQVFLVISLIVTMLLMNRFQMLWVILFNIIIFETLLVWGIIMIKCYIIHAKIK